MRVLPSLVHAKVSQYLEASFTGLPPCNRLFYYLYPACALGQIRDQPLNLFNVLPPISCRIDFGFKFRKSMILESSIAPFLLPPLAVSTGLHVSADCPCLNTSKGWCIYNRNGVDTNGVYTTYGSIFFHCIYPAASTDHNNPCQIFPYLN